MPAPRKYWTDIIFSMILLSFSIVAFWEAQSINDPGYDLLGPDFTPKITIGAIAILALTLLFKSCIGLFRKHSGPKPVPKRTRSHIKRPWLALGVVGITILYVLSMQHGLLRFWSATCLFILVVGSWMSKFNLRMLTVFIPLSITLGLGLHYIFTKVMVIDLP